MPRREQGSTPLVGSSSTTVPVAPMKAMPMDSFLFMPPESSRVCLCRCCVKPTSRRVLRQEQSPHSSPSRPHSSASDGTPLTTTNEDMEKAQKPPAPPASGEIAPDGPRARPAQQAPPSTVFGKYSSPLWTRCLLMSPIVGPAFPPEHGLRGSDGAKRRPSSIAHHRVVWGRPQSRDPRPPFVSTLPPDSGIGKFPRKATSKVGTVRSIRGRVSHRLPPSGPQIPDTRCKGSLPL